MSHLTDWNCEVSTDRHEELWWNNDSEPEKCWREEREAEEEAVGRNTEMGDYHMRYGESLTVWARSIELADTAIHVEIQTQRHRVVWDLVTLN